MSEERFEDLFNEKQVSAPKLKPGDRIEAKIAGLSGESIFLDIGGKSEGILAASELADQEGNVTVEAGDTVKVFFLSNRMVQWFSQPRSVLDRPLCRNWRTLFILAFPSRDVLLQKLKADFKLQ